MSESIMGYSVVVRCVQQKGNSKTSGLEVNRWLMKNGG